MSIKSIFAAAALFTLAASGCSSDSEPAPTTGGSAANADRKPLGKADLAGSCSLDSCGDKSSNGSCWCDVECSTWGDCCGNYKDTCDPAAGCSVESDCAGGEQCLLPQCLPGGPCPDGTCAVKPGRCHSVLQCADNERCIQPQCLPGGPCPAGFCVAPDVKECDTNEPCGKGRNCALPQCMPGGPCPSGRCVLDEGRCESDDDCAADVACILPMCSPGGPCPPGFCAE